MIHWSQSEEKQETSNIQAQAVAKLGARHRGQWGFGQALHMGFQRHPPLTLIGKGHNAACFVDFDASCLCGRVAGQFIKCKARGVATRVLKNMSH